MKYLTLLILATVLLGGCGEGSVVVMGGVLKGTTCIDGQKFAYVTSNVGIAMSQFNPPRECRE